jgi:hypothetical protein
MEGGERFECMHVCGGWGVRRWEKEPKKAVLCVCELIAGG